MMDLKSADTVYTTPFIINNDTYIARFCQTENLCTPSVSTYMCFHKLDTETDSISTDTPCYTQNINVTFDHHARVCIYTHDTTVHVVIGTPVTDNNNNNALYYNNAMLVGDKFVSKNIKMCDGSSEFECTQYETLLYCVTAHKKTVIVYTFDAKQCTKKYLFANSSIYNIQTCVFQPSSATDVFMQISKNDGGMFIDVLNLQRIANGKYIEQNRYNSSYEGDVLCCYQGIAITGQKTKNADKTTSIIRLYDLGQTCSGACLLARCESDNIQLYTHHMHQFYIKHVDVSDEYTVSFCNNIYNIEIKSHGVITVKERSEKPKEPKEPKEPKLNTAMLCYNTLVDWKVQYDDDTIIFDIEKMPITFEVSSAQPDFILTLKEDTQSYLIGNVDTKSCEKCCDILHFAYKSMFDMFNAAHESKRIRWITPIYTDSKQYVLLVSMSSDDGNKTFVLTATREMKDMKPYLKCTSKPRDSRLKSSYNDTTTKNSHVVFVSHNSHSTNRGIVIVEHDEAGPESLAQLKIAAKSDKNTNACYTMFVCTDGIKTVNSFTFNVRLSDTVKMESIFAYSTKENNYLMIAYSDDDTFKINVYKSGVDTGHIQYEFNRDKESVTSKTLNTSLSDGMRARCCFANGNIYVLYNNSLRIFNVHDNTCNTYNVECTDVNHIFTLPMFGVCSYPTTRKLFVSTSDNHTYMFTF